jgi:hypothetical protein
MTTVAYTPTPAPPWAKSLAAVAGTAVLSSVLLVAFAMGATESSPQGFSC